MYFSLEHSGLEARERCALELLVRDLVRHCVLTRDEMLPWTARCIYGEVTAFEELRVMEKLKGARILLSITIEEAKDILIE